MKAQTILVEKSMNVSELLQSKGLKPELYLVAHEGKLVQEVVSGQEVKIIPAVKGGE